MPRALEFSPELSPWIYLEVVPVLAGILTGLEIGWFSRLSYWDIFVKENGSDPTMDKILYWPSIPTLSLVVGFLNFASILMLFEGQNLWDRLTPSCCFMIPMFITFSILANLIVVGPESLYEASSESGDSEGEI